MFFEEIVLHNFATYQGRQPIRLAPTSPEKPVVLIGGKNGCGKTTLLDAFQLALFGPLARCSNRGKLSYSDFLERCINRETPLDEGAGIELFFTCHVEGIEKTFKISRTWSKKGKTVKENFFVYSIKGEEIRYDRVLSENWTDYLETFFPSNIAHLFFFDGEKIEQLADFEHSAQLLQAAIYSLLGLNVVDQLNRDLSVLEGKKQKTLKGLSNSNEVDAIQRDLKGNNERINQLSQEKASLQTHLDGLEKTLREIDARYWQQGGELFERRQELENNRHQAQEAYQESEGLLTGFATGAAPLLLIKDLLEATYNQSQKETEAERQKILVESLTFRDHDLMDLVENLNLPKTAASAIDEFLTRDRGTREESTKMDCYLNLSEDSQKALTGLLNHELPNVKKEILLNLEKTEARREKLESVQRSLAGVPQEDAIAEIIKKREVQKDLIAKAQKQIEILEIDLERTRREKEQKETELRKVLLNTAQKEIENKDILRLIDHSNRVRSTLQKFRTQVIQKHIVQIEKLVLDSFKKVLRKESLIHDLCINPENFQVELYGANNKPISTERLSAGERQLLATSLLWGICRAAGMPLPTVIDTPLGRLDSSHRTNLVQNYFPQASHQVLLLSTDEEINGKYYTELTPFISHTYLLAHDDKNGGTKVQKAYFS